MCEHSLWSLPPSELSCEATNHTTGRSGGRNLPVSLLHDERMDNKPLFKTFQAAANLGLRAGQKLREMARREEEEEVKTKVSSIVSLIPHLFHFLCAKNVGTIVWKQSLCFGK